MEVLGLRDVLSSATGTIGEGREAVIVTVVRSEAAGVPAPGARLFVAETGAACGALHPSLDQLVREDARAASAERRPGLRSYRVENDHAERTGVAGGNVDLFYEVLARPPQLVIVGAGHIAVPLARLGKLLDWQVVVVDDRPEYASTERFPEADRLAVGPYRETVRSLPIHADTAVVLVTRGHVHDQACLEEVLLSPAAYVGMIGSKRRVRTVMRHLADEGWDVRALQRVWAPVGLDIGAHTPAEIALAIAAEIVKVQRGGSAASLALGERLRLG